MRSGFANINGGYVSGSGLNSDGWSKTAAIFEAESGFYTATVLYLQFTTTVDPAYGPGNRWWGLSLRCLSIG